MAKIKISALTSVDSVTDADQVVINQGGVTKKSTLAILFSNLVTSAALAIGLATKENTFSKNTGFNLSIGTTAGTVLEGDRDALYAKLAGAAFTGDVTVSATAKIGDISGLGIAFFGHKDHYTVSGAGMFQSAMGATSLNSATGQSVTMRVNNVVGLSVSNVSVSVPSTHLFVVNAVTEASSDASAANIFKGGVGMQKRLYVTGNVGLFGGGSFGSGTGVLFIANASVVPSADPTGGGILYTEGGALKYRGSLGTITILANA